MNLLKKQFEDMLQKAYKNKEPQSNKDFMKFVKHPGTKAYWKQQFYMWPNGELEYLQMKVADGLMKREDRSPILTPTRKDIITEL